MSDMTCLAIRLQSQAIVLCRDIRNFVAVQTGDRITYYCRFCGALQDWKAGPAGTHGKDCPCGKLLLLAAEEAADA